MGRGVRKGCTRNCVASWRNGHYWKWNTVYTPANVVATKGRKNSSTDPRCIYYSGIWQELGLKETAQAENWAKKIVLG